MGILGSLVSGGFSLGSAALTNAANQKMQRESNAFNAAEAEKSRAFGAAEAEKSRAFNAAEASINRGFQRDEAQAARQWQEEFYDQFQSPEAMMRQYSDAGLNPALMYQGASGGSVPSASSPSGSAASGPAASAGSSASSVAAPYLKAMDIIAPLAQMMRLKADIDNVNSVTEKNIAETDGLIISNDVSSSNAQWDKAAAMQRFQLNSANLDLLMNQVKKIGYELTEIDAKKALLTAQTVLAKSQSKSIDAKTFEQDFRNIYYNENGMYPPSGLYDAIFQFGNVAKKLLIDKPVDFFKRIF